MQAILKLSYRSNRAHGKLFCQLLLLPASLLKVTWSLLMMSLSICRRFRFLIASPNILRSIMSRSSESCLRVCPIHPSLRCCTVPKMLLKKKGTSWTQYNNANSDGQDTPRGMIYLSIGVISVLSQTRRASGGDFF